MKRVWIPPIDVSTLGTLSDKPEGVCLPGTPMVKLWEKVHGDLTYTYPSWTRRYLETVAASIYSAFGETTRLAVSSALKWGKTRVLPNSPSDALMNWGKLESTITYEGNPSAILITHDVDYKAGYDCIMKVAEIEHRIGLRATFNFLTNSAYRLDKAILDDLLGLGHAIGLHGHAYDLRLAYRSVSTIRSRLAEAKEILENMAGTRIKGFRNHSLILTPSLLSVLEELGFEYDSGLYARFGVNGTNAFFCWPFRYAGNSILEIPVLFPQDTEMFRCNRLSDSNALGHMKKLTDAIVSLRGVLCINHHPSIIALHWDYFESLLKYLQDTGLDSYNLETFTRRFDRAHHPLQ